MCEWINSFIWLCMVDPITCSMCWYHFRKSHIFFQFTLRMDLIISQFRTIANCKTLKIISKAIRLNYPSPISVRAIRSGRSRLFVYCNFETERERERVGRNSQKNATNKHKSFRNVPMRIRIISNWNWLRWTVYCVPSQTLSLSPSHSVSKWMN